MTKIEDTKWAERGDPVSVVALVLTDTNTLTFAAAIDPMRAANRRAGRQLFDWRFATPEGATVTLTSGVEIAGAPLRQIDSCDLLMVLGSFGVSAQATPPLLAGLRRLARAGARVIAADGAVEVLARSGLLDGHRATCHWEDLTDFASRHPAIHLVRDRHVISGPYATAGGASPTLDLMLQLIGSWFGASLATQVASALVHEAPRPGNRPQGPLLSLRPEVSDPVVARALNWMEAAIDDPIPIAAIAARLDLSTRALEARFHKQVGAAPKQVYMALRLDEARRLAEETRLPAGEIALATGFNDQASFARAFRRAHGVSVRDLRARG
ncbi:GlxA family transcriptional regulator [Shimia biformata]|uniref:GlxA family transcriptional regulator n=1 Tax=Shimia biformata TaxID=1294299 RepID=UPI0019511AAF|nr:GlxA family transcriptional regulator [Shimia biformata]